MSECGPGKCGCWTCDHEWLRRGSLGDEWRECWLCGKQEELDEE